MTNELPRERVTDAARFDIPARPTRAYTRLGDVETDGQTRFILRPLAEETAVSDWVDEVLAADRYTYGDWFELPYPVYLVHDSVVATVFRTAIRAPRVELHVLPETKPAGLEAFYRQLVEVSEIGWTVAVETTIE